METLKKFMSEVAKPVEFVEIVHYATSILPDLPNQFKKQFFQFVFKQILEIPMEEWPHKAEILIELLRRSDIRSAIRLVLNKDIETAKLGRQILGAMTAPSYNKALPYLQGLQALVPSFNWHDAERIFGLPFIDFGSEGSSSSRKLHFNGGKNLFVYQDRIIGVYAHHLLAFSGKDEQIVWGIRLKPGYQLQQVGDSIAVRHENSLQLVDCKRGEVGARFDISDGELLHMAAAGNTYQQTQNRVKGGKLVNGHWKQTFEVEQPQGAFHNLETHCGFLKNDSLVLIGPTGQQKTIEGCSAAYAKGNQLFTIEPPPSDKDQCLLNLRTLTSDHEVVSSVEKCIVLTTPWATFGKLCQKGQLVLFFRSFPIFVDLTNSQVIYSDHCSYTSMTISDSGAVWTNGINGSSEIWRVSPNGKIFMGMSGVNSKSALLHVDEEDQLYYVN